MVPRFGGVEGHPAEVFGAGQYHTGVLAQTGEAGGQFVQRQTVPSGFAHVVSCAHMSVAAFGQAPTSCSGGQVPGSGALSCHFLAEQTA